MLICHDQHNLWLNLWKESAGCGKILSDLRFLLLCVGCVLIVWSLKCCMSHFLYPLGFKLDTRCPWFLLHVHEGSVAWRSSPGVTDIAVHVHRVSQGSFPTTGSVFVILYVLRPRSPPPPPPPPPLPPFLFLVQYQCSQQEDSFCTRMKV